MDSMDASGNDMEKMMGGKRRRNNMTMRKRRNNMTMRKRRNNMYGGSDDLMTDASGNEMMTGGRRNNMTARRNNGKGLASGAASVFETAGNTAGSVIRSTGKAVGNIVGGAKVTVGTKAQVWHGTAKHTSGGLTKKDLMKTKKGRIVSKKKHAAGQKAIKKLKKLGYVAKKGTFKLFKKQ
jgi:hypothetical protein